MHCAIQPCKRRSLSGLLFRHCCLGKRLCTDSWQMKNIWSLSTFLRRPLCSTYLFSEIRCCTDSTSTLECRQSHGFKAAWYITFYVIFSCTMKRNVRHLIDSWIYWYSQRFIYFTQYFVRQLRRCHSKHFFCYLHACCVTSTTSSLHKAELGTEPTAPDLHEPC